MGYVLEKMGDNYFAITNANSNCAVGMSPYEADRMRSGMTTARSSLSSVHWTKPYPHSWPTRIKIRHNGSVRAPLGI